MNVVAEIVERRRARVAREGHALRATIPAERRVPVIPFGRAPFAICEIKRRSPSRGDLAEELDSVAQAEQYLTRGARTVSILTEEDHFSGSLEDLVRVKARFPELCVLRKDFLLDEEDIEISYRAGADAVLLIAGVLEPERLRALHAAALRRGLAALVEVHTAEEAERIADIAPAFVGINARDLTTFRVDPITPVRVRRKIIWEACCVFESGIFAAEHIWLARSAGFGGVLVGEAVVRNPDFVHDIVRAMSGNGEPMSDARGNVQFWSSLFSRKKAGRPLVKVCGLRDRDDARLADELGADMLGFILAPSKRRATAAEVRAVGRTRALKAGVVVLETGARELPPDVRDLLENGDLDVIQLHGDERPEDCARIAFPYYKTLQVSGADDVRRIGTFLSPRVLIDAHSPDRRGGTGRRIDEATVRACAEKYPLWLAGGIGPDNVSDVITSFAPELIDASSALEVEPGKKDREKLRRFFSEIARAAESAGPRIPRAISESAGEDSAGTDTLAMEPS